MSREKHRIREQCLEEARQAVWALLAVGELTDSHGIDPETIRRAAPDLLLSPAAVRLAATLASATLGQIEVVSMILAGGYPEGAIADIEAEINRRPAPRPRARARRTRPAAVAPVVDAAVSDMGKLDQVQLVGPVPHPGLAIEPTAAPVEPPTSTTVATPLDHDGGCPPP